MLTGGAEKAKLKYYDVNTIRQMNTTKLGKKNNRVKLKRPALKMTSRI